MKELHWLAIGSRIDFKTLLSKFNILIDLAPYYLSLLLVKYQPARLLRPSIDCFDKFLRFGSYRDLWTPLIFT